MVGEAPSAFRMEQNKLRAAIAFLYSVGVDLLTLVIKKALFLYKKRANVSLYSV